jgi:hypothetical protein
MTEDSRGDRSHGPAPASGLNPDSGKPQESGHESRDVSIRPIVQFGIALAIATVGIQLALWGLFRMFDVREKRKDRPVPPIVAANLHRLPPQPRLEPNPLAPRRALRATEEALLNSYGWIDRNAGIARIPIDRAMEILVERGLPPSKPMVPVTPGTVMTPVPTPVTTKR